jgi:hypothetical protein
MPTQLPLGPTIKLACISTGSKRASHLEQSPAGWKLSQLANFATKNHQKRLANPSLRRISLIWTRRMKNCQWNPRFGYVFAHRSIRSGSINRILPYCDPIVRTTR